MKGHGAQPADLIHFRAEDWIAQVEHLLLETKSRFTNVFMVGFSMGGTLALHLAANYDFSGVATLAAPVKLSLTDELLIRSFHWIVKWQHKTNGSDIKDRSMADLLYTYSSYPSRSTVEVFRLVRKIKPAISRISMPILIVHGTEDHIVPVTNAGLIANKVASRHKKLVIVQNSYHILPMDFDKQTIRSAIHAFIGEVLQQVPEQPQA